MKILKKRYIMRLSSILYELLTKTVLFGNVGVFFPEISPKSRDNFFGNLIDLIDYDRSF